MKTIGDEKGQLAVEFALVAPVLILVALVIFSLARFIYLSNKFDSGCRQIIVVEGVSPMGVESEADLNERIRLKISNLFKEEGGVEIMVESKPYNASGREGKIHVPQIRPLKEYICTMAYTPIFSDLSFGYASSQSPLELIKEVVVVVDPYAAGVLV